MGDYLKVGEAAKRLGVNPQTVRNMIRDGKLSAEITDGGQRRIRREELEHLPARAVRAEKPSSDDVGDLEEELQEEKPLSEKHPRKKTSERLEILRGLAWSLVAVYPPAVRLKVRRGLNQFVTPEEFPSHLDPADACDLILERARSLAHDHHYLLDKAEAITRKDTSGGPGATDQELQWLNRFCKIPYRGIYDAMMIASVNSNLRCKLLTRAALAYARLMMLSWPSRDRLRGETRVRSWLQEAHLVTEANDGHPTSSWVYGLVSKVLDSSLRGGSSPVEDEDDGNDF